jgi:polyisoprenoid-binding protein YceI
MFKHMLLGVAALMLLAGSIQAQLWRVDPAHSSVNFQVTHMVISKVNGKFNDFTSTITFDGKDVSTGIAKLTVKTASIDTGNEQRDTHLKSPDFFDAEKYPDMSFKSTKVIKGEGQKFQLIGTLTMRGVTKEVTFNCEFTGTVDVQNTMKAGFSATTRINRQDFNISWSKSIDNGGLIVSNDVDITLNLEFIKEA